MRDDDGRRPAEVVGDGRRRQNEAADDAAIDAQAALDNDEEPTPDYAVAFTPRQLAGGFAILAAILLLLLRRRRKG